MGKDYYSKINAVEASAMNHLIGLFRRAKETGMTSSQINAEYLNYRKQIEVDKYPRYVSSYITGVRDTLTAQIQHSDLEFCYVMKDGKKYSIRKDSDMYYEKHGITPKGLYDDAELSGHYWIKTGKVYYSGKVDRPVGS